MIRRLLLSVLAFPLALLLPMAPAHAAAPITGKWVTEDGDAIVTIADCGRSLCGKLSKFLVSPPEGPGQRDVNNPDPAKRKRTVLGLPILSGFTEDGDLWRGQIYDPRSGKSYRSVVRRKSATRLEVKGCIGPFCQAQLWKRAN